MKITLNLHHKEVRLLKELLLREEFDPQHSNGRDAQILHEKIDQAAATPKK